MTFRVKIQILVSPNQEIPNGKYKDETFFVVDSQWQNTLSAINELETELINYHPSMQRNT